MKRALTLSLAAALALPLFAEEPKKAEGTTTAVTTTAAPESPLVQAAKRSKKRRAATKSIVITNDTLRGSKGGHISTSNTTQAPLNVPEPKPGPEQQLIDQKAKAAADAKATAAKAAEEKKRADAKSDRVKAAAAAQADDGVYETIDSDPAAAEHAADEAGQPQKPPQR